MSASQENNSNPCSKFWVKATMCLGSTAVFEVSRQDLENRSYPGQTINSRAISVGKHIATKHGNEWRRGESIDGTMYSVRITDPAEVSALENCISCTDLEAQS